MLSSAGEGRGRWGAWTTGNGTSLPSLPGAPEGRCLRNKPGMRKDAGRRGTATSHRAAPSPPLATGTGAGPGGLALAPPAPPLPLTRKSMSQASFRRAHRRTAHTHPTVRWPAVCGLPRDSPWAPDSGEDRCAHGTHGASHTRSQRPIKLHHGVQKGLGSILDLRKGILRR